MKTEEQIAGLGLDGLLSIAQDGAVAEPEGLASSTEALIDALAAAEEILGGDGRPVETAEGHAGQEAKPPRRAWAPRLSAVAACAALLLSVAFAWEGRPPKDTFDDPLLARAEVYAAFEKIGRHVRRGGDLVAESGEKLMRPMEIVREATSSISNHKTTTRRQ